MRVLFIYPIPPARYQIPRYQQGIGSMSAVLKAAGHQTELLTLEAMDRDRLQECLDRFDPQLVGISLTSGLFPLGAEVARFVGQERRVPVILGGIHPTICPEESLATPGVFAVCRGEGEAPLCELCDALAAGRDPADIANLWVRQSGRVSRNALRPLMADLDTLPYADRELFGFDAMLKVFPEAEFMGSRGCPYRCTYCVNHALVELTRGKGPYVRFRSVDHLLGEIDAVLRRFPAVEWLGFHDDTFTLRKGWLSKLAEKYPIGGRPRFWCNATAKTITPEVVGLLKRAGCYEVRMGIESGNDHIRREVLQKHVTREEIVRAFRLLREAGIQTYAFNMVGLPFETPATIEESIRLNQDARPNQVFCSIFAPYPGTRSAEICRENGWIAGDSVPSYFARDYALQQPTITRAQVLYYHDIFSAVVHHPAWAPVIRAIAQLPVTRTKSLWNAWRRVLAKIEQVRGWFVRRRT